MVVDDDVAGVGGEVVPIVSFVELGAVDRSVDGGDVEPGLLVDDAAPASVVDAMLDPMLDPVTVVRSSTTVVDDSVPEPAVPAEGVSPPHPPAAATPASTETNRVVNRPRWNQGGPVAFPFRRAMVIDHIRTGHLGR